MWVHLDETQDAGCSDASSDFKCPLSFFCKALLLSTCISFIWRSSIRKQLFCDHDSVSWQSTSMPLISPLCRAVCEYFSVFPSTSAADSDNLKCGFNARSDSVQFSLEITKKCSLTNKKTRLLSWSQPRQRYKSVTLISRKFIDSSWEYRCKIVSSLIHLRN